MNGGLTHVDDRGQPTMVDVGHKAVRVAVNDEFADWNQTLREGDELVFIPPVAGG